MKSQILFILVNYFNEEDTISFVRNQVMKQSFRNFVVVIVDNGSKELNSLSNLAGAYSNVYLFASPKNLGYLGGAHYGLEMYMKSNPGLPDGIILSNSDLEFGDVTLIEKLHTKYLVTPTDIAIVGTSIYSPETGVNQNPFAKKRISRMKLLFLKAIFSNHFVYTMYELISFVKRKVSARSDASDSTGIVDPVYAVHGSFFLLTKEFFGKGGTLHYPSFLFGEEIFLAEQTMLMNLKVCFDSNLKVIHHEHSTTAVVKSRVLVKYMHDSVSYLIATYFQRKK